jgi:hypothetical protein
MNKAMIHTTLSLKKLVCTRLKIKFNTYALFHVLAIGGEFPLINNTGVWPVGCLIAPFHGKVTPQAYLSLEIVLPTGSSTVNKCET